ncbi:hypothetical protein H5410_026493 [Solanum commersonii]|uniref:Uncharacterized protein n=1 Tax=Solanum commersonii TaxID=4109 RepID=A0A9J5YWP9_SOLCO|nr:hypothetical protein H5410_026493 [Solanum commersonii]
MEDVKTLAIESVGPEGNGASWLRENQPIFMYKRPQEQTLTMEAVGPNEKTGLFSSSKEPNYPIPI